MGPRKGSPAWKRWHALRAEEALRKQRWNIRRRDRLGFLPKPLRYLLERCYYYPRLAMSTLAWALERAYVRKFRPHILGRSDTDADRARQLKLELFLGNPRSRLHFPDCARPLVSILVLNYNRAEQLLECLQSVLAHTQDVPYELLVADNASTDRAPEVLQRVDGAQVMLFEQNLGFVRGNNEAAQFARGRYLLLLNNDTFVTPGWLAEMVRTLETWPRCGAVGPRLLFPDGRLQEAGAIVWDDARVNALGPGNDPLAGPYQHVREVDYCSGACLLLRTELYHDLGGLDDRYAPAYFEDVDLCFAVRAHGQAVLYQPAAVVFHHGPSPVSVARTVGQCQANRQKFIARWHKELAGHVPGGHRGDLFGACDRREGQRVLVLDRPNTPAVDELVRQGAVVTFVPMGESSAETGWFALRQAGIEVLPGGRAMLTQIARDRVGGYDAILIGQLDDAQEIIALVQNWLPATRTYREPDCIVPPRRRVG
jgi:hypothetical protein